MPATKFLTVTDPEVATAFRNLREAVSPMRRVDPEANKGAEVATAPFRAEGELALTVGARGSEDT